MKALLVINMPNSCNECFFCKKQNDSSYCTAKDNFKTNTLIWKKEHHNKPEWCPLVVMPSKMIEDKEYIKNAINGAYSINEAKAFNFGWNSCVEQILKGK